MCSTATHAKTAIPSFSILRRRARPFSTLPRRSMSPRTSSASTSRLTRSRPELLHRRSPPQQTPRRLRLSRPSRNGHYFLPDFQLSQNASGLTGGVLFCSGNQPVGGTFAFLSCPSLLRPSSNRPQQFHNLGRRDVLVIRRQQSIRFHVVIFSAFTAGLRAVERPVAPAQIAFPQILHEPVKPPAILPAVQRLARSKFAHPQRNPRLRVQKISGARIVSLLQFVVTLEPMRGRSGSVSVWRINQPIENFQYNRQLRKSGEVRGVRRAFYHHH